MSMLNVRNFILVCLVGLSLLGLAGCGQASHQKEKVTPMMLAARSGNNAELQRLIANGSDVNEKSRYGWTAIMFASRRGHDKAVTMLLDAGANPNVLSVGIARKDEPAFPYPCTVNKFIRA